MMYNEDVTDDGNGNIDTQFRKHGEWTAFHPDDRDEIMKWVEEQFCVSDFL